MRKRILRCASWAALFAVVAWSFGPILLMLISSFKAPKDIFTYVPKLVFRPSSINYTELFSKWPTFFKGLENSAIVTLVSSLLVVFLSSPAAYAFSRFRGRSLSWSGLFLIAVRMFPPMVVTVPLYPIVRQLGLADTPWVLVILYSTFQISLSTWIIKSFIDNVPIELEEAAWIDGCSKAQSFFRVVLPVIAPGLVAVLIFVALYSWNEFMFALLFTGVRAKTAPVVISEMLGMITGVEWGAVFAAVSLQLIPVLLLMWSVQRYLVKGMTIGAVKG